MFFNSRALWHCSISLSKGDYPREVCNWNRKAHQKAESVVNFFLRGVGVGSTKVIEKGTVAVHWRRVMTDKEMRGLPRKGIIE